jgi:glutamate-ammonia-ligase adenylyltransferase
MDLEAFRQIGLIDPTQAWNLLQGLAGNGVSDSDVDLLLPPLHDALRDSPDPDRALQSFVRWFAAVGSPVSYLHSLLRHPVSLKLFCLVTGCSQYFADLLVRNPEYFEILANPGVRGGTKSVAQFTRDIGSLLSVCQRVELKRDALRRWKAREMLRIGVRDLIGLSEMAQTAHEFSNLADACIRQAIEIARFTLPLAAEPASTHDLEEGPQDSSDSLPFTVVGMGKLGGQELNYSSDIDLIFVCGNDLPEKVTTSEGRKLDTDGYLRRFAQTVINTLTDDTAHGHVFRVDMRLRPEGRFGPLVRSLASCRAYYESWAEPWEFQALLKARCVGGSAALGAEFLAMVTPFVYRAHRSEAFLEEVRTNNRRIEQKCALEGETYTNVKTGYGGIRDVEFTVQRLQLAHGGTDKSLRTANTLIALQRLQQSDHLTLTAANELAQDYIFLRNLEHRLQLLQGFQTQTLPPIDDTAERGRLARRMGYRDRETFEADLSRRRDRVHAQLESLFYATASPPALISTRAPALWSDLPELLDSLELPRVQEKLRARLHAAGFTDISAALNALTLPMQGNEFGEMPPDTPVEFKTIAPRLLALAAASASPDAALAGVEAIALAVPNRAQLYASFDDSPEAMERLIHLAAGSPPLLRLLARHLEWMEATLSPDTSSIDTTGLTEGEARAQVEQGLAQRLQGAVGYEAKIEALSRYYQREVLRIGTEELCGIGDNLQANAALTRLAEATLEALLGICSEPLIANHPDSEFAAQILHRIAIVGLGKLGGAELSYGSDWDVLFTYSDLPEESPAQQGAAFPVVNSLVERVIAAGGSLTTRNARIEIDLRLRPWGRKGALILAPSGFAEYYRVHAETWERQAAVKARVVAGNPEVGAELVALLQAESFGHGLSPEEDAAVRTMKRRIEAERLRPNERTRDIKLGHGGLTDIEWLAQRLQLQHGARFPSLLQPGTIPALAAMEAEGLLPEAEAQALIAAYRRLTRLRNILWLQAGSTQDLLPVEPARIRILARLLIHADANIFDTEIRETMAHVRKLFDTYFYGDGQRSHI